MKYVNKLRLPDVLIDIIKDYTNEEENIDILKDILVESYEKLINNYGKERILREILKDQGKETMVRPVLEGRSSVEDMIMKNSKPNKIALFCRDD